MDRNEIKNSPGFYGLIFGAGAIAIIALFFGIWGLMRCQSGCVSPDATGTPSSTTTINTSPLNTTTTTGASGSNGTHPWNTATNTMELSQAYDDTVHHFNILYPEIAQLIDDHTEMANSGYIPACDVENSAACIVLPSETYPNSNFSNAGVSINFLAATSSSDCIAQKQNEGNSLGIKVIGKIPFASFAVSDGAMSHQSTGINYRAYYNKTCVELTARINTTSYEVYAEGTITRFTDAQRRLIDGTLLHIVESFRFDQ